MAKFLEYQGKEYFKKAGIPVPEGEVVDTAEAAAAAAGKIGKPVVVKAQVLAGGRGKAGGVKLASTPEEAGQAADAPAEEAEAERPAGASAEQGVSTEAGEAAEETSQQQFKRLSDLARIPGQARTFDELKMAATDTSVYLNPASHASIAM